MTFVEILLALEIVFLSYFFASFPKLKIGNFIGIALSFTMITATTFYMNIYQFILKYIESILGKIIFVSIFIILLIIFIYFTVLTIFIFFTQRKKPKESNVLIILGCRIKATAPSRMLKRRLDTAIEYLNSHPNSICVVSGGKGKDEEISEADAMEQYLVMHNISPNRIIKENKSASTWENLKFSRDITDQLALPRKMIVVTDGFHQYRAKLIAKKLSIDVTALSSKTEPRFLLIYWIRELLALTKFFIKSK